MDQVQRTPVSERNNRAHWFAGRVHEVLDEVMGLDPITTGTPMVRVAELSPAQTAETIVELAAARARLDRLEAALLTHAEDVDVAAESGATSTADWYADTTQATRGDARRSVRLANQLDDPGHEATATALLTGIVDAGRAGVIARHLHHVIDPDAADVELAKKLDAEERDAARRTMLKLFDDGRGTCHGTFRIPSVDGSTLATVLDALASPKRPDPIGRETVDDDGVARPVSAPELLGEAFRQWIDRFPADGLPVAGGSNATVVVTMALETLLSGVEAAALDSGDLVSAPQARVMACQAGVISAVLGTKSQVLDLGRRARFHTKAQRIAIAHRDRHCTALGCTAPAAWCHVHHKIPWSRGGRTTVRDGVLLCPRHHTMAHHPDHQVTYRNDGKTQITRTRRRRL